MDSQAVKERMGEILKQPVARMVDDAVLTDLVTDSFVLIDMVIELQDEFDVLLVQDDLKNVKTVADLLNVLEERSTAQSNQH
jgi:acyl carrier protein